MTGSPWTKPFHWTDEITERLKDLWGRGLTGLEIAELFGVTRGTVMGRINRLGLFDGRGCSPMRNGRKRKEAEQRAVKIAVQRATAEAQRGKAGRRVPPINRAVPLIPPPLPEPRPSPWSGLAGEVDVLRRNDCRWPLGGPYEAPKVFCKAPIDGRGSYCLYHAQMAFRPAGTVKVEDNPKGIKGDYCQWRPLPR